MFGRDILTDPIKGKVSNIIDSYSVALNIGTNHGVQKGMMFKIVDKTVNVRDPDTGEELGNLVFSKANVRITEVYEKYCLAETVGSFIESTMPVFSLSRTVRKTLPLDPRTRKDHEETVKVGDEVIQVIEEPKTS